MGSSSKTSKTELPPPTEEELKAMAQQSALIEFYANEAGYEMSEKKVATYENPALVETYQKTVDDLSTRISEIDAQIAQYQKSSNSTNSAKIQQLTNEKQKLGGQLNQANSNLQSEMKKATTTYDYDFIEKPDPRVEKLQQEGKRAEAEALKQELSQKKLDQLDQEDRINSAYLDAVEKLVTGDFSITAEQEAQAKQFGELYKEPIMAALSQLKSEIGLTADQTFSSLKKEEAQVMTNKSAISGALNQLESRIKQTGLDVEDALVEAEARANQNGIDMNSALDLSIETSRKLAENNLFEVTKDIRVKNARLASATGRATTDSNLVERLNQEVLDVVKSTELNLANMAATGKLQVSEKTADALMGIADYRVNLRSTQGQKLEGLDLTRAQMEENTGNQLSAIRGKETQATIDKGLKLEDVARMRAGVEEAGSKVSTGLRLNAAQPTTILEAGGAAINTLNTLDTSVTQSWMDRANQNVSQQIASEQGIRKAQPTTTETSSPSIFEGIMSSIGVGASGAGSILGGVGKLRN